MTGTAYVSGHQGPASPTNYTNGREREEPGKRYQSRRIPAEELLAFLRGETPRHADPYKRPCDVLEQMSSGGGRGPGAET